MRTLAELSSAAAEALVRVRAREDILEAQIVVSANVHNVIRFNFTSRIPCNGVEEVKSKEDFGIGVTAVFRMPDGSTKVGSGSEANNITVDGLNIALQKALEGAVDDPEFVSLPRPLEGVERVLVNYHDPRMLELSNKGFIDSGWKILDGVVAEFSASEALKKFAAGLGKEPHELRLVAGGDLNIICERFAIVSTSMPEVQTDESTVSTSQITSMVEDFNAKGTGYGSYTSLESFSDAAGRKSAGNAVLACGVHREDAVEPPMRLASGRYTVIFGPQAISDILNNLVAPSLTASAFYHEDTPFLGKMRQIVASRELNIYDDATDRTQVGAKGITCEGLPTRRVDLIKEGRLVGLLSNWYETMRLLHKDEKAAEKLGVKPEELFKEGGLLPSSGFRFGGRGGGRGYDTTPGISGTNIFIKGTNPAPLSEMIAGIRMGIYIGRIWYCYPMASLAAADFTATVIGDSFVIKDGKLFAPLRANVARLNDNVTRVLNSIEAVSDSSEAIVLWAADEIPVAADMLVTGVRVDEIGES